MTNLNLPFDSLHTFPNVALAIENGSRKAATKNVSGVYIWFNNKNGKSYTGSGVNLWNRILDYLQPAYQSTHRDDLLIKAFKKYSINQFSLHIVEIVSSDKKAPLNAEQIWLDKIKSEYNILKSTSSIKGSKHTEESMQKISEIATGKTWSAERRKAISERQIGKNNTFYGQKFTEQSLELIRRKARERDPNRAYKISWDNVQSSKC